jgi:phospholipid-binding lipoprotein MlaA
MSEGLQSHPTKRSLTDFDRWIVFSLLLCALLSAGGCAAINGPKNRNSLRSEASAEILTFPAPGSAAALEPTVVGYSDFKDPLIWMNRGIFAFNDVTYRYLLIPFGKGYVKVVPEPARESVGNFFDNIKMPIRAVNHLLQLEMKLLGRDLGRFGINTTLGLAGLFDPAKAWWGLEQADTDFDETLSRYGMGYGIYLVLPILGPSDLRNSASLVAGHFLNPILYLTENPERSAIQGFDVFQDFAPGAERYEILREKTEDPYIFFRNLHLQGVQRDEDY